MKDNVIVIGYKDTEFENEKKEKISLVKVSYLTKNNGDVIGYLPSQTTFKDLDKQRVIANLDCVPGLYEVEYGVVPGKNNKPELKVIDFSFINPIQISNLFEEV